MPKKKAEPKPAIATSVQFGSIGSFPICCSAKVWSSLGLNFDTVQKEPKPPVTTKSAIPADLKDFSQNEYNRLIKLNSALRRWPVRLYYAFLVYMLYNKATNGKGGPDSWRSRLVFIADNVSRVQYGRYKDRTYQRGSGFAEFCKTVPGIEVISSGPYNGAHDSDCAGYMLVLRNDKAVLKWLENTRTLVNRRLNKLRTCEQRKRYKSNLGATVAPKKTVNPGVHW